MTCEDVVEKLIDYRHRELPRAECESIAGHLSECAACALEYCRLDADLSGIARALEEQPRAEVHATLRRRVAVELGARSRISSMLTRPIPIYQAALVAIAAAGVYLLLTVARTNTPTNIVLDHYDASTIVRIDRELL
jgi:anti-sigma factor RsiW